ncbi:MAG TPA: hypothetical protein VL156_06280 [Terriglobales bacterium]|jgi:hypothetical protein|nr:hypothetical protein [Terriglobales bacterium]
MTNLSAILLAIGLAVAASGAEIHPPAQVLAGTSITIPSSGSGEGTFYLIGPNVASKKQVQAGTDIEVEPEQLERAGRYVAVLCASDGCASANFFVVPAAANKLSLLAHPSRVPVGSPNGISTVAFVFDNFRNFVLKPEPVKFSILPKDGKELSAKRASDNGVAWVRISSAKKEGPIRIGAAIGNANEVRVVQQVAAEACNLRIKASRAKTGFLVETDTVRDCSGNAVPDGTVVSFTKSDAAGKTTVDVPIKRGVAKVEMPIRGNARITVASGVVTGNELQVAGGQAE